MMLAVTETQFNEKLNQFYELEKGNSKNLEYLKDNWLNCIDRWARFKRNGIPLNLQETNNPVEVVNHQVKDFSENQPAKSSLGQCLSSINLYIKSTELKKIVLSNLQKNKIISIQNVSSDSIVNEFYKIVAPNMASWLKSQYEKAKSTPCILELGNLEEQSYVKINDKIYIITNLALDTASCNCYEYQSLNIPCRHLFYARMNQNLSLFNLNMVHDRHKINLLIQPLEESNVNYVSTIPNLDSIRSFISSKNMTQKAKWDAAWRVSQEFANCLKYKKQKDFEYSLAKLMKVKQLLQNNCYFDIVSSTEITKTMTENNLPITESFEITPQSSISQSSISQSSIITTPSKDFNYSVATKRIPDGSAPGRKKENKKKKIAHEEGQLSLYDGNKYNPPDLLEASSSKQTKKLLVTSTSKFKNVFEQRFFSLLDNILIDKSKSNDVINKKLLVDEGDLIVNGLLLSDRSYYEYIQFLKSSSNLYSYFTQDGITQFEETVKSYRVQKTCASCKIVFNQKDSVKICSSCFKMTHYSCSGLTTNTSKKWTCAECFELQ